VTIAVYRYEAINCFWRSRLLLASVCLTNLWNTLGNQRFRYHFRTTLRSHLSIL